MRPHCFFVALLLDSVIRQKIKMAYASPPPTPLTTADKPAIYATLPSAFNNDTTTERYDLPSHATDNDTPPPSTTPKRPATPPTRPRSRTLAL